MDTEILSVTSQCAIILNSHSVQSEPDGANKIWWDGDGRVSHGQHQ